MRHLSTFIRVLGVSFSLLTAPASLIGKNAKFDENIKKMVGSYLSTYSDKSASLESLQKDGEFQSLLKDAREAAKEVEKAEQKSVCEDVLNFEG